MNLIPQSNFLKKNTIRISEEWGVFKMQKHEKYLSIFNNKAKVIWDNTKTCLRECQCTTWVYIATK